MAKRVLAMVLLVLLAAVPVGCTDEEEENWWEVDREEIVVAVEFPGGTPERVEERKGRLSGAAQSVTVPYQNGELIVPKYYLYYKGEEVKEFFVEQREEMYLTGYEEWTHWAELRAKGEYKVFIDFYANEEKTLDDYIGEVIVYLTIE